jgi:hypothetical protein
MNHSGMLKDSGGAEKWQYFSTGIDDTTKKETGSSAPVLNCKKEGTIY